MNVYLIVKVQLRGFIPSRGRTRERQKYEGPRNFFHTTSIFLFYGISRYKKRPSYHDWQLGLKLYDMEYMGINFVKEIQTETKALRVKN